MSQELNYQQVNSSAAVYESSESEDGVVFSKGTMRVDGTLQTPIDSYEYTSSNGVTKYCAVVWQDPSTKALRVSCNCPGWVSKKRGQPRGCKHTKAIIAGTPLSADPQARRLSRTAHVEITVPAERQTRSITFKKVKPPE